MLVIKCKLHLIMFNELVIYKVMSFIFIKVLVLACYTLAWSSHVTMHFYYTHIHGVLYSHCSSTMYMYMVHMVFCTYIGIQLCAWIWYNTLHVKHEEAYLVLLFWYSSTGLRRDVSRDIEFCEKAVMPRGLSRVSTICTLLETCWIFIFLVWFSQKKLMSGSKYFVLAW